MNSQLPMSILDSTAMAEKCSFSAATNCNTNSYLFHGQSPSKIRLSSFPVNAVHQPSTSPSYKSSSASWNSLSSESTASDSQPSSPSSSSPVSQSPSNQHPSGLGRADAHDLVNVLSGAFAGCLTAVITCPLDVLKTRLQSQSPVTTPKHLQYKSGNVIYGLGKIVRNEGFLGLYKGLTPTLLGYLPTWLVYFTAYDRFQQFASFELALPLTHPLVHLSGAVMAGFSSTIITNPFWVVKTRLMTQDVTLKHNYSNTREAIMSIAKNDGIRGFYRGLTPSLLGVMHVAVQFPVYEYFKKIAFRNNDEAASTYSILVASTISKLIASCLTYPHEVIRTRLHNETIPPVKYKSLGQTFGLIVHENGVKGLYAGLQANLFRTVPAAAVTLVSYEFMKKQLNEFFAIKDH